MSAAKQQDTKSQPAASASGSGGSGGSAAASGDAVSGLSTPPPTEGKKRGQEKNNPLSDSAVTLESNHPIRQKLLNSNRSATAPALVSKPFPLPGPQKTATSIADITKENKFVVTIDAVLSEEECKWFIELTESIGYKQAMINIGGGKQKLMSDIRNNDRVMLDDPELAAWLYKRIAPFVPQVWNHDCKALGLNERLRFLRYDKGQQFASHYDGRFERANGECSYVTYQLYLNCGDPSETDTKKIEFKGGATTFLDPSVWDEDTATGHSVHPKTGSVLLFEHALLHRGDAVKKGRKYALRTDVMYDVSESRKQLLATMDAARAKAMQQKRPDAAKPSSDYNM